MTHTLHATRQPASEAFSNTTCVVKAVRAAVELRVPVLRSIIYVELSPRQSDQKPQTVSALDYRRCHTQPKC